MRSIEKFFMPASAFKHEREMQKGVLLIKFMLISTLFAIGYYFVSFVTGYLMVRYVMIGTCLLFLAQLFSLKYRIFTINFNAHVFVLIAWCIVGVLSFSSGGIRSFVLPWITLIPIIGLLLVGSTTAWVWSFFGLLTVVSFSIVNVDHYIPSNLMMKQNDIWTASLLIGLQFLILTITYIFDQQLREARSVIEVKNSELLKKNESLEEEITHRTKELTENNQQLEQFAFISSHNLRAPVASILGLGNLLKISQSREDEIFVTERLIHAANELDRVVKDLNTILDIKKNTRITFVDMDLPQEIDLILSSLQQEIDKTQARIQVTINYKNVLRCVRPYFSSILYNLLSNAIKYRKLNEAPEIELQISQHNQFVCITVKDQGLGMNLPAIKEKLFTLYSRFHDHIDGKGVGLYLVKTQAAALGGYVTVDSHIGVGTTFQVFVKENE